MTEALHPKLQYLLDRQDILDVVYRYCRALDRHDMALMETVFHPDAMDQHGDFIGNRTEFLKFAIDVTDDYKDTTHNITSHFCEIDGDVAHTESYVMSVSLRKDNTLMCLGGRYIDRFERRNGEWRIALRRVVRDWRYDPDGSAFAVREAEQTDDAGFPLARRNRQDMSYMRPLKLPGR